MKLFARCLPALLLAWSGLFTLTAVAGSTYFTDVPLRTKNRAKPNILMMLDNGGESYKTYSPDRFYMNLALRSGINDGSSPYKLTSRIFQLCPIAADCYTGSSVDNRYSYGDNDWHYRANDCTVSGSGSSQVVSCPSGSSAFNRLYFNPAYTYVAPSAVDSTNGNLPLPKAVATSPSTYASWYLDLTVYPNALDGCALDNPSIDRNTHWKYDEDFINDDGTPKKSSDNQTINSYDTCAWIDGYNPQLGTVNLLKNYSVAPYPLDFGMIPPQNFPKLLNSSNPTEVIKPDGQVKTLATMADSTTQACSPFTAGQKIAFVCAPGKKPNPTTSINCNGTLSSGTAPYNSIYHPSKNDYSAQISSSNITATYTLWQATCAFGPPPVSVTITGPFPTGVPSMADGLPVKGPQSLVSPYYCDLSQVPYYSQSSSTPNVIPCAKLNPDNRNIWANPGPADYFDTSGNRYPIIIDSATCNGYVQSGGQANCGNSHSESANYTIAWTKAKIQNFATWHSFYRSRLLTIKSSLGVAVNNANLNSNFRVGLASIFNGEGGSSTLGASTTSSKHFFSSVADFDTTHKKEWYDRLQKSQSRTEGQGDYPSSLHAAYLWFTGSYPDPQVPTGNSPGTGQAFLTQAQANTTTTGAASQYTSYADANGVLRATNRTGPLMYSCQPNVLVFISSGYTGYQSPFIPGIGGSNACSDPYSPGGANTYSSGASICEVDAGTVSLPSYLATTNSYGTSGPGFFYDPIACGASDTGQCHGARINTSDSNWPYPLRSPAGNIYQDSYNTSPQSSFAQLALYYWSRDLNEEFNRQKGANLVTVDYPHTDASGTPTGGGKLGVPSFSNDKAYWPHVTTYMVNLGTTGQYDYTSSTASNPFNNAGTSGHVNWPKPTFNPSAANQTYLDDMAHAATAGHGRFLSAYDGSTLNQSFGTLFSDILSLSGSQSAVAVANTQVSQTGTSYAFQSSYNTAGWTGDLVASPIQPTTGIIASYTFDALTCAKPADSTNAGWSAHCRLREMLCPGYLAGGTCATPGSNHASARTIITDKGNGSSSPGIPFTYSELNGAGLASQFKLYTTNSESAFSYLRSNALNAQSVIDYLRGDSTNENCASGATTGYRCRFQNGSTIGYWYPMGDVVDAEAVVIGPPQTSYADKDYSAWKTSMANRTPVVFQGANDGMLHAVRVDNSNSGTPGAENWAYIPSMALATMKQLASQSYSHQYYVNATPGFGDVDFNNIGMGTGAADWRTLLVGGVGKGGRGYYALNVTTPTATSASDAASKVLWTFPHSSSDTTACTNTLANMGYTYGRPALVKVASGTGIRWVALVTSGYDNGSSTGGDGKGHLYILDAKTGACLKDISTSTGSASTPIGLAFIGAHVADPITDQTLKAVYGGDQLGNVWKFSPANPTTSTDISTWVASKLAVLKDSQGRSQPVTSEPNIAVSSGTPIIYLGTGQYLGDQDLPSNTNYKAAANYVGQSIYALADTGTINYASSDARTAILGINTNYLINGDCINADGSTNNNCQFGSQFCTVSTGNDLTRCFSPTTQTTLSSLTGVHPWVFDLPPGERIITSPVIALGALMFTSNQPISDPCQPGGKSYFYMLNYSTGGGVGGSAFVSQNILDPATGDNVMASRPTIIQLPDGRVVGLVSTSVGATLQINNILSQPARRTSWREVPNY